MDSESQLCYLQVSNAKLHILKTLKEVTLNLQMGQLHQICTMSLL